MVLTLINVLVLFQSHLVRNYVPSFVFTVRTTDVDTRQLQKGQLINHYGKSRSFTTKVSQSRGQGQSESTDNGRVSQPMLGMFLSRSVSESRSSQSVSRSAFASVRVSQLMPRSANHCQGSVSGSSVKVSQHFTNVRKCCQPMLLQSQ